MALLVYLNHCCVFSRLVLARTKPKILHIEVIKSVHKRKANLKLLLRLQQAQSGRCFLLHSTGGAEQYQPDSYSANQLLN